MKKIYGISFLVAAVVITGAYYASYRYSYNKSDRSNLSAEEIKQQRIEEEALNVDKKDDDVVTNQTTYVLQTYHSEEDRLEEEEQPVPADFLGKTRKEMISYLKEYSEKPSEEDVDNGFEKFELISFSVDRIILRKTYVIPEGDQVYCLVEEDGYVAVYFRDRKTLYAHTAVKMSSLPEEIQEQIKKGKYITETSELYEFLENYSS